jgi:riboflavin synthase
MFTGIIEAKGTLHRSNGRLIVESNLVAAPGDSVAVNGCCLTHVGGEELSFDVSDETLRRTTLGDLASGTEVNLESAIKAGKPMGGHFVLGHVDAVGKLLRRKPGQSGEEFRFQVPIDGAKYLVDKGSIAIDGVSLTVVEPNDHEFSAWLIPHTLRATCFNAMQPGTQVNIEYDVLARYLERLLQFRG